MVEYQVPHTYQRGCPQVVANVYDGDQRAMALVALTGCPETIIAAVEADSGDPSGYTALLTWDNSGQGTVDVRWDAGQLHPAEPDAGTMTQVYLPGQEGVHTVTVTDSDDPARTVIVEFEVPVAPALDLRIEPDPTDPSGWTALAIWGPTGVPPQPGQLDITIRPEGGDATGYTAVASWTTGGTP